MLVSEILKGKSNKVWTVDGRKTIRDALEVLVENKIGAVLVLDSSDRVSGVLSERDIMRVCHQHQASWGSVRIEEAMTPRVIMCKAEDTLDYVMNIMTQQRIRHVPVMADGKLCGIVSIGDVVKTQLKASQVQIQYLKDYLHGA